MNHAEIVSLIRAGVPDYSPDQRVVWADLGAGGGNFTRALADLLPPPGVIHALDLAVRRERDEHAPNGVRILWRRGDFTRPLDLPTLDGVLMANALHFVPQAQQPAALRNVCGALRPGGRLVLVEYEPDRPLPFVPYPVAFSDVEALAAACGLNAPVLVGRRRSPRSGVAMAA
ncbi:MAG: class I SAM-dependent methyltransferase, partial [Anaerolineae bacterium]|nr:class I SAM-dependent methyltransferase [Anaerolineae bacterium]